MKIQRFECQLIAKLIWVVIHWKIFFVVNRWVNEKDPKKMCSVYKFFKQAVRTSLELKNILWKDHCLIQWMEKLLAKANRNLLIEKKKNKSAFYEQFSLMCN